MSRGDFEPVAIVGRSCVLPGATSPAALWEAVSTGRDLLSSAPADRWRLPPELALTDDPARSADRSWSDRGGYVSGFDALLAAAPLPEEVHGLDWVFQWSVWAGREALRDAGHDGRSDRVGAVFGNLGFPSSQMSRFAEAVWFDRARPDPRDRHMSGLPALLLARVLGLGLGAYTLDAACASSLYALHLACAELHDRRADLMLAGAVCRSDDLFIHVGFCALQALSRTGRSRPFHAEADGLVPAEGAAFVALKRLADAEAAGDRVLGVIRGIGLSNDGRGRGLLAPSSAGQQRALHQAWDHSGLDPAALGLVECHATGTTVGDATEVETLQAVLGAHHAPGALPVGSFKSNCGHLITAAGAAGLLKVLGALEHHQRPPTLHAQQAPHPALARSALRLVHELEGWPSDRPRVGAVSAFGFGGNNAHLIVTEHEPSPRRAPRAARAPIDLAVVGLGARVADGRDIRELSQHLLEPGTRVRGGEARSGPIALPLRGNRFPPTDLSEALPQQLALLAVAREAVERLEPLPRDRTSIHIGAQSDPEVARYGARWRLRSWLHGHPADVLDRACDGVVAELSSAGVVGNMPNIPANRLNSQLDVGGPGFTVAAEELSGLRALEIASRALRVGETDAAVVGAVDLCCEPVHAAASALLPEAHRTPGDAAVVLVLKRHADAVRDGDPVYAVFPEAPTAEAHAALGTGGIDLAERFGHAHAASGLVHVVAAVLACRAGRIPGTGAEGARPGPAELQLDVVVEDMLGTRAQVRVAAAASPADLPAAPPDGPALQFAAHPPPIRLPSPEALAAGAQLMAPAPALPSAGDTPPRAGATGFDDNPPRPFPAPPVAAQAPVLSAPVPTTRPAPVPAPPPTRPTLQGPVTVRPPPPAAARLAAWHSQLSALHQTYLNQQAELHARFLRTRAVASDTLLAAIAARGRVVPQAPTPPIAAPPPRRPAAPVAAPPPPVPDPVPRPAPAAAPTLPGPKFSRSELESLASDRISVVLGPLFARQDPFPRQVRMPEPPLLLADRVTGIDAEPGSMKLGTIWTETDVTWGAWYLHQGHMPAGVMIEAGQADLLLISYLGADFHNRGERVYRLLGCELTYSGGLPAPGDTLAYEIHVDGHASQGDTRLFFFHYDCRVAGDVRLSVRQGQAGFFSDLELAESGGVLWDADTGEHIAGARVDPPVVRCTRSGFTRAQLEAFADGDGFACFGPGFERLQTHVRTPRMSAAPLLFFDAISSFDPAGGPWGRGYLRAEERIAPDDWFFDGHFKDDPCMPGTLMFEGCLQALALYMAGLGFTLHRDGWRFEPVPDVPYQLICRGQVIPTSQHLTYEVFVEEVVAGPVPTVYADFLCTVDGLKAFHARRVGLQLVPDWPLSDRPEVLADHVEPRPVAVVDGFPFGYASLIACAWGRPSHAFGPMYEPFDAGRHCARLPGPPYHFMTRITRVDGAIGGMEVGTEVELEYDVPPDAWYFDSNGNRTMPYCVLLEAALQPCGWIACYIGSALTTEDDLYFRNLDGTATWKAELFPQSGTLRTIARITNISLAGGMIIESFVVRCLIGDTVVYEMDTVFGFFPTDALANQIGITPTDAEREALHAPCDFAVDLTARPARYCGGFLRLPDPMLLMLDRITGFWPEGGKAGLGALRSEKDVDPSEWFFKAHFYTDPVQPGSLGIEAMVQLLQFYMLHTDLHAGMAAPRFEPLALNQPLTWKYRGQVVPHNETIRVELEITEVRREDDGSVVAIGDAWLWVDRLRIYQAIGMGMRIVDGGHAEPTADDPSGERVLDPQAEPWLADHRPTWTAPSLPAMSMVDRMAGAAAAAGGGPVSEVRDVQITRWVVLDGPTRTRVEVGSPTPDGAHTAWPVSFEVWREARDPRLSRFEAAATATVVLGPPPPAPEPLPELVDAAPVPDPYAEGRLFHGPAFHYLRALELGANGSRALLDPTAGAVPAGTLHQGLLDALTHALPHDSLHLWSDAIGPELVAYPHRVDRLAVYGPAPTGPLRVEARFDGFADEARSLPRFRLVATDAGRCPWVSLELTEVLLPKGPIGSAPPAVRQRFLRDAAYADGLGLSTEMGDEEEGGATRLTEAQVRASDWLPGTVARAYRVGEGADLLATVAAKDHVARRASVHPGAVSIVGDRAYPDPLPLTSWPLEIRAEDGAVEVRSGPPEQDISRVRDHWAAYFDIGRWPVEDLYYALIARFVGRVVQPDPEATRGIRGRSALYLANHQVMIESLLFSILASGVYGVNTVTLAKIEHQRTWLGQLIAHCFAYPDVRDPEVIAFFDREDKASLPRIIGELAAEMVGPGKSAMVHVEGTRSTTCRTPVLKMSSAFVDLALRTQAPIVPVRFVGGLPADPVPERIPFPLAMGRQDLWIGAPLWPAELEALPYKERKVAVIEAINGLGPSNAVEEPLPGDPEFAERVAAWEARTGATPVQSALYCALAEAPDPCPETAALLDAERTGTLEVPDDPRGRWLAELAEPMFGPRGPTVRRR